MFIILRKKSFKLLPIISFCLICLCACVYDQQKHIGTVINESTRNIEVKLCSEDNMVTDTFLNVRGADCYIKPLSSSEFYINLIPAKLKSHKWYFYFFDQDTLKKYLYTKKITSKTSTIVTQKAFLKKVCATQQELDKRIKLFYKKEDR